MILLLLLVALISYALFSSRRQILELYFLNRRCKVELEEIPGPSCLPIIGLAHLFKRDNTAFTWQLDKWAREYMIHDHHFWGLVKAWVGPVPLVFCGMQESIRKVLESNINITKPNHYDIISEWIGTGLLTSTNEKWFSRRKLLTPTFHYNILQQYQKTFAQQGEILVDLIASEEKEFNIFPYIKRCALDIICETAMGTSINAQTGGNNDYVEAVQKLSAFIWDYQRFPWLWFKPLWYLSGIGFEFNRLVKLTNDFTRTIIAKRKLEMEEEGIIDGSEDAVRREKLAFLDLLLRMQHEDQLSDEDIREEVDTFMFEGEHFETIITCLQQIAVEAKFKRFH